MKSSIQISMVSYVSLGHNYQEGQGRIVIFHHILMTSCHCLYIKSLVDDFLLVFYNVIFVTLCFMDFFHYLLIICHFLVILCHFLPFDCKFFFTHFDHFHYSSMIFHATNFHHFLSMYHFLPYFVQLITFFVTYAHSPLLLVIFFVSPGTKVIFHYSPD